ncbi:MAG: FecR domain-containing protein [Spirochaetota bacterium]
MRKLKLLLIVCVSLVFFFSCTKETKQELLKIQSIFGDVTVQMQDTTRVPEIGQIVSLNDVVITGKGAIVDLIYRNAGIIRINENTTVKIESLMKGDNDDVVLTVDTGKTFATLGKLKKGDNFAFKSKTVIAAVRGTSFRMVASKEGASVDVVTGKVMVKPVSNNTVVEDVEVVVEENQTVALDTKTVETIVQKIEEQKAQIPKQDAQKIVEEIKETIKPVETPKETIKEIKQEVKDIPVVAVVHEEVKQEISKVVEEDKEAKKREEEEKLKKEKAEKAMQLKLEKERQEKMMAQKLEQERLEKEKAKREKEAKEQKIKEDRVKNIPTL